MSEQSFVVSVCGGQSVTVMGYVRAEFCCISLWKAECYWDGLCQSSIFVVSVCGGQSVTGTGYVRAAFCCISLWRTECYCEGLCQSRVLLYQFVEDRVLL